MIYKSALPKGCFFGGAVGVYLLCLSSLLRRQRSMTTRDTSQTIQRNPEFPPLARPSVSRVCAIQ